MFGVVILSVTAAHASDGVVLTTHLRASEGTVRPVLHLGLSEPPQPDLGDSEPPQPDRGESEPPQPDFEVDGTVATISLRSQRDGTFTASLGLTEDRMGIAQVSYLPRGEERPVVVYGDGAVARFFPPDPCAEFAVVLGDGTTFDVAIDLRSPDGSLDGLVGYGVRADEGAAALELDVEVASRGGATLALAVSVSAGEKALVLE